MLSVEIQSTAAGVRLRCTGRIVLGVEAETLRCMVIGRRERCLILDLRYVHAIDAAGLGLLAELHCWAIERKGLITIANPSRRVRQLLALTRLEPALIISYSSISEAEVVDQNCSDTQQALTA